MQLARRWEWNHTGFVQTESSFAPNEFVVWYFVQRMERNATVRNWKCGAQLNGIDIFLTQSVRQDKAKTKSETKLFLFAT